MAKNKKWSEQILVKQESFTTLKNGKEVEEKKNVLYVCTSGMEMYRKNFIEGKYKGKGSYLVPFDFIVLAGPMMCAEGKFYEVEYTIGEYGVVYRALIQAVNPVTDIRLILGTLKRYNKLPAGFTAQEAILRSDIEQVCIGSCYYDKDEKEPIFTFGTREAKESEQSIVEQMFDKERFPNFGDAACFEYYRGDVNEVWARPEDKEAMPPVLVYGGNNVDDEAFAQKRDYDMFDLKDAFDLVTELCNKYKIPHFMFYMPKQGEGCYSSNIEKKSMTEIVKQLYDNKNK